MRHLPRCVLLAVSLALSSCATFPSPHDRPVEHLEKVLSTYMDAYPGNPYPKNATDLERIAAANGVPFDRSIIDIDVSSGSDFVLVRYTVKGPQATSGHIAVGRKLH